MTRWRSYFQKIAKHFFALLDNHERASMSFAGESSSFVRLNRAKIRQIGQVDQAIVSLTLVANRRNTTQVFDLSGDETFDRKLLDTLVGRLRDQIDQIPEDPYFQLPIAKSDFIKDPDYRPFDLIGTLPELLDRLNGFDFAGIFASGPIFRATANSNGLFQWFATDYFCFDWSLYTKDQKALKQTYSGNAFSHADYAERIARSEEQLKLLDQPFHPLTPGQYDVYLAPKAVMDLLSSAAGWGAFSYKAFKDHLSPFNHLATATRKLNRQITLADDIGSDLVAPFNDLGFARTKLTDFIVQGTMKNFCVAPRTAMEYSVADNGADSEEQPIFLSLAAGTLAEEEILATLGDGLYINNLHYLNFSDRTNARITGMTRYACFLVENGRLSRPFAKMRFDDTLYRIFGENLVALTTKRETLMNTYTYRQRNLSGGIFPGALVQGLRLTL